MPVKPTDRADTHTETRPEAGRRVAGRYVLVRPLGAGGAGDSFLARALDAPAARPPKPRAAGGEVQRHLVIKILAREADSALTPARVAALSALKHPNLAPLLESGTDPESGRRYLVRPWIDGVGWVSAARLAGASGVPELLAPVCRALAHLHERGLGHGRLHPGNVWVVRRPSGEGTNVLLGDFGICAPMAGDAPPPGDAQAEDFRALGWLLLQGLVPEPDAPAVSLDGPAHGDGLAEREGSADALVVSAMLVDTRIEPHSPALAYVVRRCLGLDAQPPFHSALEILDEVNRRAGLDLAIEAPELRQSLVFDGRMVGRQNELERLKMRMEALTGGGLGVPVAPLAVLLGESGIGKSRLMREILAHASRKKVCILSGACREGSRHPYAALEEVVRSLAETLQARRDKEGLGSEPLHPTLAKYGSEIVKVCPALGRRHGFEPSPLLEPEQEKMRLIDQVSYFIHDSARHAPILLTIEDLHWSDEGTLDLLRYLCRAAHGGSLHVLATARREEVPDSPLRRLIDEGSGEGWLEQVPLERLPEPDLVRLTADFLGLKESAHKPALERLAREAEGNPYQLQEILCDLVEKGVLTREDKKWRLPAEGLEAIQLPTRVTQPFLDRLHRLDPREVQLLRLLATYGRPASVDHLAGMLARPRWEVQRQAEALVDRAILERQLSERSPLYAFRHARQGEALYKTISPAERQALHALVVTHLRAAPAADEHSHNLDLVRHLVGAAQFDQALEMAFPVLDELLKRNAPREALEIVGALNSTPELSVRARVRLMNIEGTCALQLKQVDVAARIYDEGRTLALASNLKDEATEILSNIVFLCLWSPNKAGRRRGILAAREAYSLLRDNPNPRLLRRLLITWAGYYLGRKELHIAQRLLSRAEKQFPSDGYSVRDYPDTFHQGIVATLQGRLKDARAILRDSLSISEQQKNFPAVITTVINLIYVEHLANDFSSGQSYYTRADVVSCVRNTMFDAHLELGWVSNLIGRGQFGEALLILDKYHSMPALVSQTQIRLSYLILTAQLNLLLGRIAEADRNLQKIESSELTDLFSHHEHEAMLMRARIQQARDHREEAFAIADECRRRGRESKNRRQEAEALQELVELSLQQEEMTQVGELVDTLWVITEDGESWGEFIGARIARAAWLRRSRESAGAERLLAEASECAEEKRARVWLLKVLCEQLKLASAQGEGEKSLKLQATLDLRIEEILNDLPDDNYRSTFLHSGIGRTYSIAGSARKKGSTAWKLGSVGMVDLAESFRVVCMTGGGMPAFCERLNPSPAYVMTGNGDVLELLHVANGMPDPNGEGILSAVCEAMRRAAAHSDAPNTSRPRSFSLPVQQGTVPNLMSAVAVAGTRTVCLLYQSQGSDRDKAQEYFEAAASLAVSLVLDRSIVEMVGEARPPALPIAESSIPTDDPIITGRSESIRTVLAKISVAARGDVGVLIEGESGTGKELVARRIHQQSVRSGGRFVALDCGAIPESLIESELFGHKRGAFTGADRDKPGLFEEVAGGTLLLDEIGNAGANLQAKLLRVLQEREVRRVGETRARSVDFRVIAATNADLRREVAEGKFREDLLYRLSVVTIRVPPLRERKDDIPLIAARLLAEIQKKSQKECSLSRGALDLLMLHNWPGNVRELRNVLEGAALAAERGPIGLEHLPDTLRAPSRAHQAAGPGGSNLTPGVDEEERQKLLDALTQARGDKTAACRLLGWNRMKLYRRLKQFGVPRDFGKPPRL